MSEHVVKTGWITGETYCAKCGRAAGWPCPSVLEDGDQ